MTILYWSLVALMSIGVIGAVVPAVPGSSLILLAILVWGIVHGFSGLELALAIATLVLVLSISVDFLATYLGAKYAGASKWGQIGAIVGFLLGFFGLLPTLALGGPLLGIIIGPFLGAVVGEFLYCRNLGKSIKAGIGIVLGSLLGNLIQGALALTAVVTFLITTLN
ncbi:MAG: DUF456 family protein [Cyanothece sp. SIO1E1]|nr:DUF456 family protein [Cyanothece sp. SIO1E1]